MSEEKIQTAARRQKRVKRLKTFIILVLFVLILMPSCLCVFLFVRMQRMDGKLAELAELTDWVEVLAVQTADQQTILQELFRDMQTTGQGTPSENAAAGEVSEYYELTVSDPVQEVLADEPIVHKVYLTFDDGPSVYTEEILDILDQYDVKATFFVVGKESEASQEALIQIVERGHSLGMHSYTHKYVDIYNSVENFAEDFVKLRSYLEEVTGVTSSIYRFPGGSSNTISNVNMWEFADYLESWDVQFYDWNVASGDGSSRRLSVDELVRNSLEGIESRTNSIILLHDAASKRSTVDALPVIIENILAMENTEILPITEETIPIQHIHRDNN